jgi:hypothetical protein
VFSKRFHSGGLGAFFADLIDKHDARTNGQLGELSTQKTVSMEIYFPAIV